MDLGGMHTDILRSVLHSGENLSVTMQSLCSGECIMENCTVKLLRFVSTVQCRLQYIEVDYSAQIAHLTSTVESAESKVGDSAQCSV